MAAAYQTGTATSPTDLLQKLVTWLVAQGWTQDASAADGSGWRAHLHKGGLYANLRAAMNESIWNYNNAAGYGIGLYLGDAYSGAASWKAQSGGPIQSGTSNVIGAGMQLAAGAISAYHFFDDGADHISVVVEKSPGIFVHVGWGPTLAKVGFSSNYPYFYGSSAGFYNTSTPSGGPYPGHEATAICPMSQQSYSGVLCSTAFFKVDAAVFSAQWVSNGGASTTTAGWTGRNSRCALNLSPTADGAPGFINYAPILGRVHQTAYPGALLLPLHNFVATATARYAPCGYPASVFYCRAVGNGFAAGDVYPVGGVNYKLFPYFAVLKGA